MLIRITNTFYFILQRQPLPWPWFQPKINYNAVSALHLLTSYFTIFLGSIHKNVFANLDEIEKNYKYLHFNSDYVNFIGEFLRKPEQFTLQMANTTLRKMEELYQETLEELAKSVNIFQRLDLKTRDIWQEYRSERKKMNQMMEVLWEIESREEKVAELDDWREEAGHYTSPGLETLCNKIDIQNKKILKYKKKDVQQKWKTVESDLKKLQLLRVEVKITPIF